MNKNQSPGVSGPAPTFVSCSSPSASPRTRQVADLFQPVTSSAPPAAAIIDQPVMPVNGLNQDGELPPPARQPGNDRGARRWSSRGARLVVGTPGAAVGLVASAALVLVVGGMAMFTTSSSTESPVTALAPGRLPAPVMGEVSNDHPATVAPVDAPVALPPPGPAKAYSPAPPPAPAHQQPLSAAHRTVPAPAAPPPAPDNGPVASPPQSSPPQSSPPSSTVTNKEAGYWTIPTDSHSGKSESPRAGTQDCCNGPQRKLPDQEEQQSTTDQRRDLAAQRAEYRSKSKAQESTLREQGKQNRQAARPDVKAGPRQSPSRGS